MSFAAPDRLVLVAVVVLMALGYVFVHRRRPRCVVRFTNLALLDVVAPRRPGWRRHVPAGAMLISTLAMVLGLARPVLADQVLREEASVVLAIDVSPSMMAADVPPSRFAAAEQAVGRFVGLLPDGTRVGLVSFAGSAHVVVPPTTDHDLVVARVGELRFRSETALGEAIHASLDALAADGRSDGEPGAGGIVLLSDGQSTTGRAEDDAAERARRAGVAVSTISFGTPQGTVLLGSKTVPVPVDGTSLERIATVTGGGYFEAATAAELASAYQVIGRSVSMVEVHRDVTEWFLAAAFTLALIAGGCSLLWFARLP